MKGTRSLLDCDGAGTVMNFEPDEQSCGATVGLNRKVEDAHHANLG